MVLGIILKMFQLMVVMKRYQVRCQLKYRSVRRWPVFELAYVRTFKLTPYVYLFRHLFSIIWCIDHAWFHYYDFILSKTKNNFSFFWMRWFFALTAISGLAQGETCVTLDSTRYYYRRMESNRAEILLRLEHDSSRNVLNLNHVSF